MKLIRKEKKPDSLNFQALTELFKVENGLLKPLSDAELKKDIGVSKVVRKVMTALLNNDVPSDK